MAARCAPMSRPLNFSPGPATLPLPVLEEVRDELVDYQGTGISMLEHSHRGKAYDACHEEAIALLEELVGCKDTHHVLFMGAGATGQFATLPMVLLQGGGKADYVDTGAWSKKAFKAASFYGEPRWAGSGKEGEKYVRAPMKLDVGADAKYVHLTSNATISGVQYHDFPDVGGKPLIADMSSDMLHKPIDAAKFGVIYAGAQKNLGPAGVAVAIVRKDVLEMMTKEVPDIFNYHLITEKRSTQNTPPAFPIYVMGKVLKWVKAQGGPKAMAEQNAKKGELLYGVVDEFADFYRCPVEKGSRSIMNAVFNLPTEDLEKKFIADAAEAGMLNLKGHRSVGGIRVSMYNAMPVSGVETLVGFMREFQKANG